jgi:hypothetical protein
MVGNSRFTSVSKGTGVNVEVLDVGVSSTSVEPDTGIPVVCVVGKLQDDSPRMAAMMAIQKRFLILSSFSIESYTGACVLAIVDITYISHEPLRSL